VLQWGFRLGLDSGDVAELQEEKLLGDMCVAGFDWLAAQGMAQSGIAYHRVRVRSSQRQHRTLYQEKVQQCI